MTRGFAATALLAALWGSSGASAQQAASMPGMDTPGPAADKPGMAKMMHDMAAVPMTGDVDRDFVGMMIPHHQGAIDMARAELAHGKDPALLKLARRIVAAQDKEIAAMQAWQARHPAAR